MSTILAATPWPVLPADPLVLVPLGSTEQHGRHLPTSTDTLVATAVAEQVATRLSSPTRPVVVAPAVAYSCSGEHQGFAGTMSIGADALHQVLLELVRSLSHWASRVLVVNGHGGNIATLTAVIPQLRAEQHDVTWVPCASGSGDAHAGFTETCLVLHLAPHLVALDRAEPGNIESLATLLPTLLAEGVKAVSPSGVLGDPTGATAQEGERLLAALVGGIVDRVEHGTPDDRGCLLRQPLRGSS